MPDSSFTEADVRDSLATQLELIEPGLTLIEKERLLPNDVGARGFIDIFARDRYDNFVVIEVKRRDQTARQAVQEVLKYAELLEREHGIATHRIRLMIASTDWHELQAPFSALARLSEYALQGFQLAVNPAGEVTAISPVQGLPRAFRGEVSPDSVSLVCSTKAARDQLWTQLERDFGDVAFDDMIGLELDYRGASAAVIYPFALALFPGRISPDRALEVELLGEDDVAPGMSREEAIEEGWEPGDGPSLESEAFDRLLTGAEYTWDDTEAFSPGGLVSMQQRGWIVTGVRRRGSFAAADYMTDEELVTAARGLTGLNSVVLSLDVSPTVELNWSDAVLRCQQILEGNDAWQRGVITWLEEREQQPAVDHHMRIYHPGDIVRGLIGIVTEGSGKWLDELVLSAGDEAEPDVVLAGIIVWGGGGREADEAFRDVLGGQDDADAVWRWATGGSMVHPDLMRALDLRYVLIERAAGDEDPKRYALDGEARRTPISREELASFERFLEAREESLRALAQIVAAHSMHVG